ncbi:hypothetical protein JO375_08955 [Paenibacillus sp. UY79]|nr:hypothetical protein [Paenibacillus farraposensis]MCC3379631.1 hypothetical protein [Paenibacillus farraposensis]
MARSTFYYEARERVHEDDMTEAVVDIFQKPTAHARSRSCSMNADSWCPDAELAGS